jgi:nicotinamide phosphoribosyltransferase
MIENNICLLTDSYKITHHYFYPKGTQKIYSYLESRVGAELNKTIFYGLQYIIKKYLEGKIVTQEKIDEAEKIIDAHIGKGTFNRQGWQYILDKHNGKLPLRIKAVPEGTPVDINNVMMTVENTDLENCAWLTNYVETELLHVWYSMTVATLSRECKIMIKDYLTKTTDDLSGLDFMLHDFGERGSTTLESAALAGSAHLINFKGTDTVPAIPLILKYYGMDINDIKYEEANEINIAETMPGFSVAATEHSIMTARGEAGEFDVVEHLYNEYTTGILSTVIDSYNYEGS